MAVRHAHPLPLTRGPALLAPLRAAPGALLRSFGPDAVVRRQGTPSPSLCGVEAGAVALRAAVPGGRRAILAVLGPGDVFGHEAVLDESPSDHALPGGQPPEARTVVPSRILFLPGSEVRRALASRPETARWILGSVARTGRHLEERLALTLTAGVQDRLLGLLDGLARRFGRPLGEACLIDLPLTQEALADLVGATRESVNRSLRDLARSGRVRRTGRFYVVGRRIRGEATSDRAARPAPVGPDGQGRGPPGPGPRR